MGPSAAAKRLELTLLEELASGTFARVYLAEARGSGGVDRLVAVKVLREKWADSEEVLARTRDEARLLARLRHKHIVRVEELSELDGQPAIIMEYVEGMDLQQILDRLRAQGRRFPQRAALQIAVATASALDAAYRRVPYGQDTPLNVVHRDIKPSNVMVSIDGEVKVLDFGTARATSPLRSAQTGLVRFGSWKYMSPERKEGDRGDHAADIYSLGLLLVELLGSEWIQGLAVSPGEHDAQFRAIVERIPDMGMPNEAWAAALRDLLLQMAAFSPDVRPSAQQLIEVLRQYSDQARGEPVDILATEVVQAELRAQRQQRTEGALTGTRLYVSLDGVAPPQARRADPGEAPEQPGPAEGPATANRADPRRAAGDDFDEPATIVEPFPSPGHYAMGAAQVRFNTQGDAPQPARQPAQQAAQRPTPAPREPRDPAPTWGIAASQSADPPRSAAGARPEPATAFQPIGAQAVETEYLPAPEPAAFGTAAPGGSLVQGPVATDPYPSAAPVRDPYGASTVPGPAASWATGPVAFDPPSPPPQEDPWAEAPYGEPEAPRKRSRLPLILGGIVVLILLCAGAPVVGYVGYTQIWPRLASTAPEISLPTPEPASPDNADNAGDAPEPPPAEPTPEEAAPAEPAEPASPEPPEPPAVDDAGMPTAPITVQAADRMIRRIELAKPDGTLVLESKGSLEGAVPPGPYRLTVKLAGRDPLAADVTLDVTGLHVACAPDEKMVKVLCRNGDGAIPLVLGGK